MSLVRSSLSTLIVSAVALTALAGAQINQIQLPPGQTRDTTQPTQPTERRIPVGTSSISGTVVSAETGRPVSAARVSVSGQVSVGLTVGPLSRGGVIGAPGVGSAPPVGAAQVSGGLRGASPQIGAVSGLSRTVTTDVNGQFSFPRLPAGQFQLSTTHGQFLPTNYGQKRSGDRGAYIQLAAGQQLTLNVAMARGGVITGRVLGPDGAPQPNAQVRGWRYTMASGFKRLQATGYASTDDRGVYRMFGLQPGEYLISATPNLSEAMNAERFGVQYDMVERAIVSGQIIPPAAPGMPPTIAVPIPAPPVPGQSTQPPSLLATYAPSSMTPSGATAVAVAANEERVGVDVFVQHTLATNIQGQVSTPLDPGVGVQVSLTSEDASIELQMSNARTDATGKFTLRGIAPGKYTVVAQTVPAPQWTIVNGQPQQPQAPALADAQKMWARAQVTVNGEPTMDVDLQLRPARSISGIVVFDMAKAPDLSRSRVNVTVAQAPSPQQVYLSMPPQVQVGEDGRFTLTGVVPGRLIVRASGGGGFLKSAVVAGQDLLDFPLEFTGDRDITDVVLTMTDTTSELNGTIMDSTGAPAAGYMILAAAADNRYWLPGSRRIVVTQTGPDGRYTFRGLPSGPYMLAALTDLESGVQYDPEFLRMLAGASVAVTILEGGKFVQDIRVR